MGGRPVTLGAYPATQCPVRTHHAFDPDITLMPAEQPPAIQEAIDAGLAFEQTLFDDIASSHPDRFCLVDQDSGRRAAVQQTLDAMDAGVPVILRGVLPDDVDGHRVGRPDLLVRHGDDLPATYLPGEVKLHRFLEGKASNTRNTYSVTIAPASDPQARRTLDHARPRVGRLENDALQLAHYTRMLESMGRHPGPEHHEAFLVSGDDWVGTWQLDEVHGTWIRLDEPAFETYSRSESTKKRTALERYDHEFGFRVAIAENAAAGKPAIVVPIYSSECDGCPMYAGCEPTFAADPTTSFETWRPRVREWLALRTLGITTVEQLAAVELTPEWVERYLAEIEGKQGWRKRLGLTIEKARLAVAGHTLAFRAPDSVRAPRADVEIDLDMENDTAGRVFLWGARLRRGDTVAFHAFVDWNELTLGDERAIAERLADWLVEQRDSAAAAGESIMVFHHGDVERQKLRLILGPSAIKHIGIPFFDTHQWAEKSLVATRGLGLKPLAGELGFEWRDDDPGGRNCQIWVDEARATADAEQRDRLQQRVLDYNEDDTAATAWIRDHTADLVSLTELEGA